MYLRVTIFPKEVIVEPELKDKTYPVTINFVEKGEANNGVRVFLTESQLDSLFAELGQVCQRVEERKEEVIDIS